MTDRIGQEVANLQKKYHTNDPFELFDNLGVDLRYSSEYRNLKGFCFISNRIPYVMVSSHLSDEEKTIVAAHELGHLRLHRSRLQYAFMTEEVMYVTYDNTEYEANRFAADLLLADEEVAELLRIEGMDIYTMARLLHTRYELIDFKFRNMNRRGIEVPSHMAVRSNFLAY